MSRYQSWLRGMEHSADGKQDGKDEREIPVRLWQYVRDVVRRWGTRACTERHDFEEVEGEDAEGGDQIIVKGRVCAKGQACRHRDQEIKPAKGKEAI